MSEKHDAMWGADAGGYIAQQEAEIARLRAALEEIASASYQCGQSCASYARKALAKWGGEMSIWNGIDLVVEIPQRQYDELKAEIARLRAALVELKCNLYAQSAMTDGQIIADCREIAREALADGEGK